MQEIWKQTSIRPDYEVSNLGRVRRKKRGASRCWINPLENYSYINNSKQPKNGYFRIRLNGKKYSIHRLIAETFIPNPDNKPEVNHKDGNKLNNHISNLEWVTHSENTKHAFKMGLIDKSSILNRKGKNNPNYKHGNAIR
jgi:hypothetical protein